MKKVLIIALVLLTALSVFAADGLTQAQKVTQNKVYRPDFTTRFNKLAYRIWDNPAELAGGKFAIDLPEIAISVNNVASFLGDDACQKVIANPTGLMSDMSSLISVLTNYIGFMGRGTDATNEMLKLDIGFGSEMGGFAFRTDVGIDLNTYVKSGKASLTSIEIIPEVNAAVSLGLGLKIINTDALTVKAGASVHPSVRAFTESIGASSLMGLMGGSDSSSDDSGIMGMLKSQQLVVGWAVPFDVSASVGFMKDTLKVYAKANNILGTYHYAKKNFDELTGITSDVKGFLDETMNNTFEAAPFELDFGACWEFNFIGIHPTVYAELNDMYDYCYQVFETEKFSWTDLYGQLNWGAEVTLFKVLQLGFGYSDGYKQIAAGVGINDIRVQAMYGAHDYNNNSADTLTVVVKLGWDANK